MTDAPGIVTSVSLDDSPAPRPRRGEHSAVILAAARRLIDQKGESFTTQELIKEAGVALQTFYRCFAGKDQLLLALIEDMIGEACELFEASAQHLDDPLERLRAYVTSVMTGLQSATGGAGPRFIVAEHWRLHQLFPDEMAEATKPLADLVQRELERAEAAGLATPSDAERDAWLVTTLVMAVYHHYAFHLNDPNVESAADDVWSFCLAAIGGGAPASRRRFSVRRRG